MGQQLMADDVSPGERAGFARALQALDYESAQGVPNSFSALPQLPLRAARVVYPLKVPASTDNDRVVAIDPLKADMAVGPS